MKNTNDSLLQEFRDQPNLDDKDLVNEWVEGSYFSGYEDEGFVPIREGNVFVPTRKELLVLFKHWYKERQGLNYHNSLCVSLYLCSVVDEISHRLYLIGKFLPKEVLEAISKQMNDEDLKLREKEWPEIAKMMGEVGEEEEERQKQLFLGR